MIKKITQSPNNLITLCALFLFLSLSGCGYTTRSLISNQYKTIYIPQFVNKITITRDTDAESKYKLYRPYLETDITKAVINKYLTDGNLKPVKEDNADLILKAELVDYVRDVLRYDNNENVQEYRIRIVVNMTLWDRKENKMVWQENGFAGEQTYFTSGSQATPEATAVSEAIANLALRIVERTVEQW